MITGHMPLGEIEEFVKATDAFTTAVKNGDIEKAKSLYGPAGCTMSAQNQ